jgi:2-keto-3-deoxy-L-rhamnonate aldolase RhmA
MYPNGVRAKLKAGEIVLGTALAVPSPIVAGMILSTEPDFVWLDLEHQPFGTESLGAIPALARMRGVAPMIRVAWNDPALIKKAYDVGAVIVMIPQVNTVDEAKKAVEYSRYPPEGSRGISPTWPMVTGEDWVSVIKSANEETVLVIQLESVEAFENIDEIAKVPGIDVILVGPMDLSASLGKITETGSKEVQAIMKEVPKRLEGTGIAAGTTLGDLSEIQEKLGWGYRFMNVGNAISYGAQTVKQNLEILRKNPTGAR